MTNMNRRKFFGALAGTAAAVAVVKSRYAEQSFPAPDISVLRRGRVAPPEQIMLHYGEYDYRRDRIVQKFHPFNICPGIETVRVPMWTLDGIGSNNLTDSGLRDELGRRIFA